MAFVIKLRKPPVRPTTALSLWGRALTRYPELIERVRDVPGPDTHILIGADLPTKRASRGAVALDVGPLTDYMVDHRPVLLPT